VDGSVSLINKEYLRKHVRDGRRQIPELEPDVVKHEGAYGHPQRLGRKSRVASALGRKGTAVFEGFLYDLAHLLSRFLAQPARPRQSPPTSS
jgi:hypothetical protein